MKRKSLVRSFSEFSVQMILESFFKKVIFYLKVFVPFIWNYMWRGPKILLALRVIKGLDLAR